MNEHPILMSGPMIRAILEGRKVMTRRVIKPQPQAVLLAGYSGLLHKVKYLPGDSLWVRETWSVIGWAAKKKTPELTRSYDDMIVYKADCDKPIYHDWRPSIFMPRWASRLTLSVTGVRVDRVQDISEADAIAEGVDKSTNGTLHKTLGPKWAIPRFQTLWDSINGKRPGCSWLENPFVWVISFKRVEL